MEKRTSQPTAASAIAHHGELVQGVFVGDDGRLHRGLVTLPYPRLPSTATFVPTLAAGVTVQPALKTKAAIAARYALKHIGAPPGGDLKVESTIPVGHGYGSSTADVIAAIRAVMTAYGVTLRVGTICQLAVAAEQASDAVAYEDRAVLFAQREGVVLEDFGGTLPPLLIVGFKANGGHAVDTLALAPARYTREEIQQFRVLRGIVACSVRRQDPRLLGQAATASARISQRYLPKAGLEDVLALAAEAGACGVQVAHSGSLVGIIFDLTSRSAADAARTVAVEVRRMRFKDVETYALGQETTA